MKLAPSDVVATSTVPGDAEAMTIDPAAMEIIMRTLTNLYSDPELAVVREISCNALDSHVEAGNQDPILVTSPSHFSPVFTVQDFGTGMSLDTLLNVYARYGASTKRGCRSKLIRCEDGTCADCQRADTQVGAFGIGAKSPFAVGGQFVVTAVKDGMKSLAVFALGNDGAPTVKIVSHEETIEPDGVKVEVGVRNVDGVKRAIDHLFGTWERGTVLVDGEQPACAWDNLEKLAGDIHLSLDGNRYSNDSWVVVMGGVPYKLPPAILGNLDRRAHQIARNVQMSSIRAYLTVPIGAVDITPSREELRVTPKTTATLTSLIERFGQAMGPWIGSRIADAGSLIGAMVKYSHLKDKLGSVASDHLIHVTWQGQPLNQTAVTLPGVAWFDLGHKRGHYGEYVASRHKDARLEANRILERFLFVTGVPERRVRSVQLAAKPYLQDQKNTDGVRYVVALPGTEADYYDTGWFSLSDPALAKIDYDSFVKTWKPQAVPARKTAVQYEMLNTLNSFMTADELKSLGRVFYLTHHQWMRGSAENPLFKRTHGGSPVILLKSTQKAEALIKRLPGVISLQDRMQAEAESLLRNLTPDDLDSIASGSFLLSVNREVIKFLAQEKGKITSQAVLGVIAQYERAHRLQDSHTARIQLLKTAARHLGRDLAADGKSSLSLDGWVKIEAGLPLLFTYFMRNWNRTGLGDSHVIDYINKINL